ncbi:hypothetical protein [Levilactobacillus phage ENFP1]|nr:hypothetical protein [Levilactobacillus phage ENFP1]
MASNNVTSITTNQTSVPLIELKLYTEHNIINLKYDDSIKTNNKSLTSGVVSFQTKNAMEDDSSAFSIILSGDFKWDYVIFPNDIISLGVKTNQTGVKNSKNTKLITGMITEVHRVDNYDSDNVVYQLNGRSMANAFMQYKIGLIEEVQESISSMGWLWDTNMDYEAETIENKGNGDSGASSSATSGSVEHNKKQIWDAFKEHGFTDAATAGAMGNMSVESAGTFKPNIWEGGHIGGKSVPGNSDSGYGLIQWTASREAKLMDYLKRKNVVDTKEQLGAELDYFFKLDPGSQLNSYKKKTSISSATWWFLIHVEGINNGTGGERVKRANEIYKQFKGKSGSSDDDSSSSDSSSSSSKSSSGNTNATQAEINNEKEHSTGVAFLGNTCATIEGEIMDRFLPYLKYSYGTESYPIDHFINYSSMTSWDSYEKLQDSSSFVNFKGSLYELQDAILHKPFVEMFYDTDYNGLAHLVVRRTPFNPSDWNGVDSKGNYEIPRVVINSNQVINDDLSKTNSEAYSVFNVNPATANYTGIKNAGELGSLPQFNQQLVNIYGYSILEVTSLYLKGSSTGPLANNTKASGKNSKVLASAGTPYTASDINKLLNKVKLKTLRQKQSTYAQKIANNANNISGQQAAELVSAYLINEKHLTQTKMNGILDTENGGGQSCIGGEGISYKKWLDIVKSYSDAKTYMQECKTTFNNTDDEVLFELRGKYASGGNKLSQKDFKSLLKKYQIVSQNTKVKDEAIDLKFFTQMLFNWYSDDINFLAGNITVPGDSKYRIGEIAEVINENDPKDSMEFYIESVEHTFSFTSGWQTVLGVTRGLKNLGKDRFKHMWGKNQDFLGGYMGEAALDMLAYGTEPTKSSGGSDSSGGSAGGDWGFPFKKPGTVHYTNPATTIVGQNFGCYRDNHGSHGGHDGTDFGFTDWPNGGSIRAVHGGTVKYAGPGDTQWTNTVIVITEADDGYSVCYQEFGTTSNVKVKKGDKVKTGDVIGTRGSGRDHVHVGVTKHGWKKLYNGSLVSSGFEDPLKLIAGKNSGHFK